MHFFKDLTSSSLTKVNGKNESLKKASYYRYFLKQKQFCCHLPKLKILFQGYDKYLANMAQLFSTSLKYFDSFWLFLPQIT